MEKARFASPAGHSSPDSQDLSECAVSQSQQSQQASTVKDDCGQHVTKNMKPEEEGSDVRPHDDEGAQACGSDDDLPCKVRVSLSREDHSKLFNAKMDLGATGSMPAREENYDECLEHQFGLPLEYEKVKARIDGRNSNCVFSREPADSVRFGTKNWEHLDPSDDGCQLECRRDELHQGRSKTWRGQKVCDEGTAASTSSTDKDHFYGAVLLSGQAEGEEYQDLEQVDFKAELRKSHPNDTAVIEYGVGKHRPQVVVPSSRNS